MPTLHHVHDPMCSWCYAFAPTWKQIRAALPKAIDVRYVPGGLAPDTDEPMPDETRAYVRDNWKRIQQVVPGTRFNYDFWTTCTPRRSTYPACRAVLAARHLDAALEEAMIDRIQTAYYREARNPSDIGTLHELAGDIGLDRNAFEARLASAACDTELHEELALCRSLGVSGFPSLVMTTARGPVALPIDYTDAHVTLRALQR